MVQAREGVSILTDDEKKVEKATIEFCKKIGSVEMTDAAASATILTILSSVRNSNPVHMVTTLLSSLYAYYKIMDMDEDAVRKTLDAFCEDYADDRKNKSGRRRGVH